MGNKPVSYSVILSAKASKEIEKSWLWYEDREQKLGDRFVSAVLEKIKSITTNPDAYSLKHKNYREAAVAIFPFTIIYTINPRSKLIKVISVFHTSQHPDKKY
jgi:plasmid stabilization system protein ParE